MNENKAGTCICKNPYLKELEYDVLYHLGLSTKEVDMKQTFGDVKFVCTGGSASRMKHLAELLTIEAGLDTTVTNLASQHDRYVLFKVKSVLCASHGIGVPSLSILIHELLKLVDYAGCKNVTFIRVGTCGGLGVDPGTIVISNDCMDALFNPFYELKILGKIIQRPCVLDQELVQEFCTVAKTCEFKYPVVVGKTICADDFYEEQARLDGAVCTFTEKEKMSFLQLAYDKGVRNFEMECTGFSAQCHHVGVRAGILCVAMVNRLLSDQVTITPEEYETFEDLPCRFMVSFLKGKGVFQS